MLGPSLMPEPSLMTAVPRNFPTTRSNSLKRCSGTEDFVFAGVCYSMSHFRAFGSDPADDFICVFSNLQAVRGFLWPGTGGEWASDKGGPAWVSWWDEGQLQGPDPRAVQHNAWAGRQEKGSKLRETLFVISIFEQTEITFVDCLSAPSLLLTPSSSLLLSLLTWTDWMVMLFPLLKPLFLRMHLCVSFKQIIQ